MSDADKEIQKTLEEMRKRAEAFQENGNQYMPYSSNSSKFKLQIILAIIGVITVLGLSVFFYISSKKAGEIKAPAGYKIIYPTNGPPRLDRPKL